ncbi:MAG: YARHG domain-containing protein [Proteobacteria bacterium]|nr:MAG: YARHG domain-containing protein [Pseudomonadota bacterium]
MKLSLLNMTRGLVTLLITMGFTFSASGATWPKTPAEFAAKGPGDMKPYADIKVTLGKPLSPSSLKDKTETELSLMRNSIYAQAGLKFSEPWLQHYFGSRAWYTPGKFDPKTLGKVDIET